MTAIAWKDGLLAVDSLVSMSAHKRLVEAKALSHSGWLCLGSGTSCDTDAFKRAMQKFWPKERIVEADEILRCAWPEILDDTSVIFWRPGESIIFREKCHPEYCRREEGAFGDHDYLTGAMHAGKSAEQAVIQACWHADGCGFPVAVYGYCDESDQVKLLHTVEAHESPSPSVTKSGALAKPPMFSVDDQDGVDVVEPGSVITAPFPKPGLQHTRNRFNNFGEEADNVD